MTEFENLFFTACAARGVTPIFTSVLKKEDFQHTRYYGVGRDKRGKYTVVAQMSPISTYYLRWIRFTRLIDNERVIQSGIYDITVHEQTLYQTYKQKMVMAML